MACLGFANRWALVLIGIQSIPWVAFFIIIFGDASISRASSQLLCCEAFWGRDARCRFVRLLTESIENLHKPDWEVLHLWCDITHCSLSCRAPTLVQRQVVLRNQGVRHVQHVESCHDISDHFTSVELGLECVKVVPELKPRWKHVILDPPNPIVVTGNLLVEPFLQTFNKRREDETQPISERVGLAD